VRRSNGPSEPPPFERLKKAPPRGKIGAMDGHEIGADEATIGDRIEVLRRL
jgi:hypothetical protein